MRSETFLAGWLAIVFDFQDIEFADDERVNCNVLSLARCHGFEANTETCYLRINEPRSPKPHRA